MLRNLWKDEDGFGILTAEYLFIATILVLGLITGFVAIRQALISELVETAQAFMALNQSFSFTGQSNCESSTAASAASDVNNTINESSTGVVPSGAVISQTPCD
jgi:hypothetical protein